MRYCLILAVLAPLTLPSVQASDVRAQAKEHAKDKAVQPQQVLRLTLDGPSEPLVLDRALSGQIPIRVWAENLSDKPIIVCRPVDGCMVVDRDPRYTYRLVDAKGREVRPSEDDGCPWKNVLQPRDFLTLKPKEKTDLLKTAGVFGELTTYLFPGLQPGEYTLTLRYSMTGEGKIGGKPAGLVNPNVPALLQKALKGEFTSNAVKVRFVPAPATDELLKTIDGKGEKLLSPANALLVVGSRRDQRGYQPALAALSNKDREVRWAAVIALREYAAAFSVGQMKHKDIMPPELLETLAKAASGDPDRGVREVAAIGLKHAQEYQAAAKGMK